MTFRHVAKKKNKDASNAIRVFDDILQFGAHLLVLIPT